MPLGFASPEEALSFVEHVPPRQGGTMLGVPLPKLDRVRVGLIGTGGRGRAHLEILLRLDGVSVEAVYDPDPEAVALAGKLADDAGRPAPDAEPSWEDLCGREDLDMVYICSPWDLHAEQAVKAMECGKHAAVEVPVAVTLEECWRLVDTSEKTRRHCIILENCNYGEEELLALSLVRAGVLGTVTHAEAAYIHDLRSVLFGKEGEGVWRRKPHMERDGNLYPTHGLGPVAWYMDINRGDRFARLVSMSSISAAMDEYRDTKFPPDSPVRKETYRCGDMNTSLIRTAAGRTVLLQHDVVTPRPYTRLNLVQGSRGTFAGFPPRVFLAEWGEKGEHDWKDPEVLKDEFQHPLWREFGSEAVEKGGHGGMDYIMNLRLVRAFLEGRPPDMDVYDASAWSAPGPLSEISVAFDSLALPFPDFTRGEWETARPVDI